MNKTMKAGLALFTLLTATGVHAQTGAGAGAAPVSGTGVSGAIGTGSNPAATGTSPMNPTTGVNAGATDTSTQNLQNAQSAQANSVQANPTQTNQQAGGGGVFGPSRGPGVFGPTSGSAVTTDIYGNQQPAAGTVQPSGRTVPTQGGADTGTRQPARGQNPISYDANGQPLPSQLYPQTDLPRSINPAQPSGAQQVQPGAGSTVPSSGTVTGR